MLILIVSVVVYPLLVLVTVCSGVVVKKAVVVRVEVAGSLRDNHDLIQSCQGLGEVVASEGSSGSRCNDRIGDRLHSCGQRCGLFITALSGCGLLLATSSGNATAANSLYNCDRPASDRVSNSCDITARIVARIGDGVGDSSRDRGPLDDGCFRSAVISVCDRGARIVTVIVIVMTFVVGTGVG